MKEIKLSNDQRKVLWNEVKECEELINLHIAPLFQNEMSINISMVDDWSRSVDRALATLRATQTVVLCLKENKLNQSDNH